MAYQIEPNRARKIVSKKTLHEEHSSNTFGLRLASRLSYELGLHGEPKFNGNSNGNCFYNVNYNVTASELDNLIQKHPSRGVLWKRCT